MQIYFDTCSLQRPLDDRTQPRINMEAEAVLTILGLIEGGHAELVSSEALEYEIERIPDAYRRNQVKEILGFATKRVLTDNEVEAEARQFLKMGIKPMDALHLASANQAEVNYFCTSDDRFLKKAGSIERLKIKIVSPLKLVMEVTT